MSVEAPSGRDGSARPRRPVRSLQTACAIVLPLALALWGAAAAALGPSSPQTFTVAVAPAESYTSVAVRFAPVTAPDLAAGEIAHASPAAGAYGTIGSAPTGSLSPPVADKTALAVRISADRTTVKPGDQITYGIEVRNVGQIDATNVLAETHVPAGTSMSSRGDCVDGGGVANPVCSGAHPGGADPSTEHLSHPFGTIRPGGVAVWWFTVTVDLATPIGTSIINHAHALATNAAQVTSDSVVVTVK